MMKLIITREFRTVGNSSVRRAWFFLNGNFAMGTSFEYHLINYLLTLAYSSRIWQALAFGIVLVYTNFSYS